MTNYEKLALACEKELRDFGIELDEQQLAEYRKTIRRTVTQKDFETNYARTNGRRRD